jgi:hypothetical protein
VYGRDCLVERSRRIRFLSLLYQRTVEALVKVVDALLESVCNRRLALEGTTYNRNCFLVNRGRLDV